VIANRIQKVLPTLINNDQTFQHIVGINKGTTDPLAYSLSLYEKTQINSLPD
jgi:hypothetical protein